MPSPRRFPPPWTVEELEACFIVRDHDGQQLAYVYYQNEPGRRSAAKLLSKDETIALNVIVATGSDTKGECNMPKCRLARRSQLALAHRPEYRK
jgi:hypothetical protein